MCLKLELNLFSEYRNSLMGIAIFLVLLCHARMNGAELPEIFLNLFSFGNWGVDVFLFLSGLGMYYSLNINKSLSLKKWYIRRLKRVLIPYLIIETPYWLWYTVSHNLGVCDFVYYISMLSYWKEHVGLWFLALLIPLYALVPLMFRIFNLRFRFLYLILLILACMVLSQISPPTHYLNNEVLLNIQLCLSRVPAFLFGLCIGQDCLHKKTINMLWVILILLSSYLLECLLTWDKSWIWGLAVSLFFVYILQKVKNLNIVASFLGKYTLELYIGLDVSTNMFAYILPRGTFYYFCTVIGAFLITVLFRFSLAKCKIINRLC